MILREEHEDFFFFFFVMVPSVLVSSLLSSTASTRSLTAVRFRYDIIRWQALGNLRS